MKRMMDVPKIRGILGVLCLAACCVAPTTFMPRAIAAGVRLAPKLENGRTLTYEIARTLRVEQTPAAEPDSKPAGTAPTPTVSKSELELVVRLDVGSVRADGTTEVGVQLQSLRFTISGSTAWEFVYPTEVDAAEIPDGFEPAPAALKELITTWTSSKPRLVVNREGGLGELLGMDALAMAIEEAKKSVRTVSQIDLASLDPDALRQLLTPIFLPAAPEPASRLFDGGETWTVRRTTDLGQMGSLVIDEGWIAAARGAEDALAATGQTTVTTQPPRGIVTAAPTMEIERASGVSSLKWDSAGASLVAFSRGLDVSMKVSLGDISLMQTQSSSLTITRKD